MPTTGGVRTLGRVLRLQVPQIPRELDYLAGKHMHNLSRNLTSYGNRKLAEAARIDAARRAAVGKSYEGAPVESLVEIRKGLGALFGRGARRAAQQAPSPAPQPYFRPSDDVFGPQTLAEKRSMDAAVAPARAERAADAAAHRKRLGAASDQRMRQLGLEEQRRLGAQQQRIKDQTAEIRSRSPFDKRPLPGRPPAPRNNMARTYRSTSGYGGFGAMDEL